jgi:membrane protein implicated in regulation of membrane protease activity
MRIVGGVVGLMVLAIAVVVGGFVLAAFIGFALIAWLVIYARLWWLARRAGNESRAEGTARGRKDEFVEAEYRVIETKRRDDGGQ